MYADLPSSRSRSGNQRSRPQGTRHAACASVPPRLGDLKTKKVTEGATDHDALPYLRTCMLRAVNCCQKLQICLADDVCNGRASEAAGGVRSCLYLGYGCAQTSRERTDLLKPQSTFEMPHADRCTVDCAAIVVTYTGVTDTIVRLRCAGVV